MILTILEATVAAEQWPTLQQAYQQGIAHLPAQMVQTFLVQQTKDLCWLHGISVRESAVCTSTISYSSHFALLKFMELNRRWRTALPIFSKHA